MAREKSATTRRRDRRRAIQVGVAGLLTLGLVLFALGGDSPVLYRLSSLVFDFYQNVKPRPEAHAPIVIVDIDENSLREVGQWPWPRSQIAEIVDRLGQLGAATIAFDVVFSEPDRTSLGVAAATLVKAGAKVDLPPNLADNDDLLAAAFGRNPVTAGFVLTNETDAPLPQPKAGFAFAGADPQEYLLGFSGGLSNLSQLSEAATGLGFYSFPPSPDGIVRVVPLLGRSQEKLYPALSIEALRTAQGASSFVIRATGASGEADTGRPAMTALKVGSFEVPTGALGDFRIYFSGLASVPRIPAAEFLDPAKAATHANEVAGTIVLIGTSAVGLRDLVATPRAASQPGVEVHAEIIDQVIGGTFLTRPDWAPGAEIALAVLLTLVLLVAVLTLGPLLGAVAALVIIAGVLAVSWFAFANGQLVLDPILPSASVLSVYVVATALLLLFTDRERQFVRRAFAFYLAPAMVERLAEDPAALALGGETREITILFSDIRGFTSLSEKMDPQQITGLLNRFLTPMTDVLLKSGATIDKYIGDAIMAFWNAPLATPNHPRDACLATLGMFSALEEMNRSEGTPIRIGVGLNTGMCCVGNLGSEQRFSYSAIGDSVNVASRVEGLTKQYGLPILITEFTAEHVQDLALIEADRVRVVGRAEPLAIFTLLGDETMAKTREFEELRKVHDAMLVSYRAGRFPEAAAAVESLRRIAPPSLQKFYELYVIRIESLSASPPSNWDGVFTVLEK
jgi:adenylate cyclase